MDDDGYFTEAFADGAVAAGFEILKEPLQDRAALLVEAALASVMVERIVD